MFAAERQRKIREILLEYKEVSLSTLCSCLSSSVSTIRRDLDKLEEENFLKRTHGGAILVEALLNPFSKSLPQTEDTISSNIYQIARLAAKTICNSDMIYLSDGKICQHIASLIKDSFSGYIYTNSIDIALLLSHSPEIKVFLLGGLVNSNSDGINTEEAVFPSGIDHLVVNKAYLDVSGITLQHGYFVETVAQQQLYRKVAANSSEIFTLLDPDKIDKINIAKLDGHFSFSQNVITTSALPDIYKQAFNKNRVKVYTSFAEC